MPERSERSPLSQDVIRHLRRVANQGVILVSSDYHGAMHGTSLEAINTMVDSGFIIGHSQRRRRRRTQMGALSIYPTPQLAIDHLTDPSIAQQVAVAPQEAKERAKVSAKAIAQRHALLTELKIPLNDRQAQEKASDLAFYFELDSEAYNEARKYFLDKKFSPESIDTALKKALLRRGFLVALSPDLATTSGITLSNGDKNAADIRVITNGKGVPYSLTSGLQPLGLIEEAFLRNLFLNG